MRSDRGDVRYVPFLRRSTAQWHMVPHFEGLYWTLHDEPLFSLSRIADSDQVSGSGGMSPPAAICTLIEQNEPSTPK